MPYLRLEDTHFPLLPGETRVGRGRVADVGLPSDGDTESIDAIVTVGMDQSASVRRASRDASVAVNDVALGTQPTPLFHGDRITIQGIQLLFADEAHSGLTTQVPVVQNGEADAKTGRGAGGATSTPTAMRGSRGRGRLVSLTDGREYTVGSGGLSFGRDAACDVVISSSEVSRRHARIELRPEGYVLVDLSTNGLLVNDERAARVRPLARGDRIVIGPEEFRFHADVEISVEVNPPPIILATPPAPARSPIAAAEVPPPPASLVTAAPDAVSSAALDSAASTAPTAVSPAAGRSHRRPVLATLENINEGPSKGTRFEIRGPLTHVGRGEHNDLVIPNESVSDTHAKIQRREGGWFVVDIDSTNGTYVSGQRILGEVPLSPASNLRFGGVKFVFRSAAPERDEAGGTRVIVGYQPAAPADPLAVSPESSTTAAQGVASEPGGDLPGASTYLPSEPGIPKWLLGGILLLAFVVVYLILQTL
jgi:pSer/pThr/pTyr-binding forkhead associated (FHA) protein